MIYFLSVVGKNTCLSASVLHTEWCTHFVIPEDITVCIPGVAFCNSNWKSKAWYGYCAVMCEKQYTCKVKLYTVLYDTVGLTSAGKWNTRQLMLSFWGWQRSANCCIYNEFEVQMFRVLPQGLTRTTRSQHQLYKLTNLIAMCLVLFYS